MISKVGRSGSRFPLIIDATSSSTPRLISRSRGNLSIASCAPTPLAPMPSGFEVDAAASTPPKSLPSRPMCPIASMLGAPCWPLKCMTSAVKESWPPSPNVPRVFACVAASANAYGGLTEAIGDVISQV